ncbi:winged helix-turn-helix domain-containing protein [Streptosporangium sp. CA-115845]
MWKLLRRHGWSCQVPARRAIEYDEKAVTFWKSGCDRQWENPADPGAWV